MDGNAVVVSSDSMGMFVIFRIQFYFYLLVLFLLKKKK